MHVQVGQSATRFVLAATLLLATASPALAQSAIEVSAGLFAEFPHPAETDNSISRSWSLAVAVPVARSWQVALDVSRTPLQSRTDTVIETYDLPTAVIVTT